MKIIFGCVDMNKSEIILKSENFHLKIISPVSFKDVTSK